MFTAKDRCVGRHWQRLGIACALALSVLDLGCASLNGPRRAGGSRTASAASDRLFRSIGLTSRGTPSAPEAAPTTPPSAVAGTPTTAPAPATTVRSTAPPAITGGTYGSTPQPPAAVPLAAAAPAPPPAAPSVPVPVPVQPAAATPAPVASLIAASRQAVDSMNSYRVRMNRQERVGTTLLEPEEVVLNVRREPHSVRLEWPSGPSKGREVIYVAGQTPEVMHINIPGSLVPRITLPVNSPLALKNSRHPISEAGLDAIVTCMENWLRDDPQQASHVGRETAEAFEHPLDKIVYTSADGEKRVVYIDSQNHLPAVVQVNAPNGDLLESYRFQDIQPNCPELASAEAFDPSRRWGAAKGLLSRLADAASEPKTDPATVR